MPTPTPTPTPTPPPLVLTATLKAIVIAPPTSPGPFTTDPERTQEIKPGGA